MFYSSDECVCCLPVRPAFHLPRFCLHHHHHTHTHIIFGSQKNAHNNSRKFIIVYAQCGHVNSNDSIRIFKTFECYIVNAERVDCFGKCKQKPTWQQNSHTVLINMDSGWSRKRAKISAYIVYCRGEIRLAQCVAPCVCVSDTHE